MLLFRWPLTCNQYIIFERHRVKGGGLSSSIWFHILSENLELLAVHTRILFVFLCYKSGWMFWWLRCRNRWSSITAASSLKTSCIARTCSLIRKDYLASSIIPWTKFTSNMRAPCSAHRHLRWSSYEPGNKHKNIHSLFINYKRSFE